MALQGVKASKADSIVYMTADQIDGQRAQLKEMSPGSCQYKTSDGYMVSPVILDGQFMFPMGILRDLLWQSIRQLQVMLLQNILDKDALQLFTAKAYSVHEKLLKYTGNFGKGVENQLIRSEGLSMLEEVKKVANYSRLLKQEEQLELQDSGDSINIAGKDIKKTTLANLVFYGTTYNLNEALTTLRGENRKVGLSVSAVSGLLFNGHLSGLSKEENIKNALPFLQPLGVEESTIALAADQFYL